MRKHIDGTIKAFAYIVIAIQTVFSIVWIVGNINGFQNEYISVDYVNAANTLVVDDYMGILYALIIRIVGHGPVLFFLQLLAVGASAFCIKGLRAALITVTNPVVLLVSFTVSPIAFVTSCVLFALSLSVSEYKRRHLILYFADVLFIGLLSKEGAVFLVILLLILNAKKIKGKMFISFAAIILSASIVTWTIGGLISQKLSYDRVEKSFETVIAQRVVLPEIVGEGEGGAAEENGLMLELEMARRIPDTFISNYLYKYMLINGEKLTKEYCTVMTRLTIQHGAGYCLKPIAADMLRNMFPNIGIITTALCGKNDPTFAVLFTHVIDRKPNLFRIYFFFSMLSGAILGLFGLMLNIKKMNTCAKAIILLLVLYTVYITIFNQPGFDFRNSCIAITCWPLLIFKTDKEEKHDTSSGD